jgi:hypothetical protein
VAWHATTRLTRLNLIEKIAKFENNREYSSHRTIHAWRATDFVDEYDVISGN